MQSLRQQTMRKRPQAEIGLGFSLAVRVVWKEKETDLPRGREGHADERDTRASRRAASVRRRACGGEGAATGAESGTGDGAA